MPKITTPCINLLWRDAMLFRRFPHQLIACACIAGAALSACNDDISGIGGSLADGEVTITVDSLETKIDATTVYYDSFDGRNSTKLLGRLRVPEYGSLRCSFVTQLLSATSMSIPDSISENEVDSMRLVLSVPRGSLTGDSLAPQQLNVYRLSRQLPADISTSFDPDGYYSASGLMGSKSYTLSNIAKGDSALKRDSYVRIPVKMPKEFALDLFRRYRNNDPIFQWPSSFNEWFPGIFVEQNFGNGCVANISRAEVFTYWHYTKQVYEMQPDSTYKYVDRIARDSTCLLASQPEVLSSNIISYEVSDKIKQLVAEGKSILTTPGGYRVDFTFPARRLLDAFLTYGQDMSMVSSLRMSIPATTITNDYGISVAPYLLMVKTSQLDEFFAENKVPDGLNSFYATYSSTTGSYHFNSMRDYFLDLLKKRNEGKDITDEDLDFTLVPADVTLETVTGYYNNTTYVTKVQPYLTKPTMTELATDRTVISFIYSSQIID